jgi:hypothetical protein
VKKIEKMIVTGLLLGAVLVTVSCSARDKAAVSYSRGGDGAMPEFGEMAATSADYMYEESVMREAPAAPQAAPALAASAEAAASEAAWDDSLERKLVKQANINIRVENLETADASINALMTKHGAYAASTVIDENSRSYSIRVPSPAYDVFLREMDGMGRTLHRSENVEDVTLRYYDLEGRLATKKELLKTYQSYLGKAKNIEEILSVESRIADLQYEIDGTGKELRALANRVDYAAIELYVGGPVSDTPYRGPSAGERISELFRNFGKFIVSAAVVLTGAVIYGIPVLLLLVFLYWLLLGRIGLLKKLWRAAAGKKHKPAGGA